MVFYYSDDLFKELKLSFSKCFNTEIVIKESNFIESELCSLKKQLQFFLNQIKIMLKKLINF